MACLSACLLTIGSLTTGLFADLAEDFSHPHGTLFSVGSGWSFHRDGAPPVGEGEPAEQELFEVVANDSPDILPTRDGFVYRTSFLEKSGGGTVLLVRAGSSRPRAVYSLPEHLHIGPGESLYFSVLTQDLGGPPFGWLAFADGVDDDPSLGFRQSGQPLRYAARARDARGITDQTEGTPLDVRTGRPNLIVGKVTLGANGSPDRVAILANPASHRDIYQWESIAEMPTGLSGISKLWIRKGNVGGKTVYDRIRVSRYPDGVLQDRPVVYSPLFGVRNLARNLGGLAELRLVHSPSGEAHVEFQAHRLPTAPDHLSWGVEFSSDLETWSALVPGEALTVLDERPDVRGVGDQIRVRHELPHGTPGASFYRVLAAVDDEPFDDPVVATVHIEEPLQTIDGFGASLAYTAQNITDELADLLFDPEEGLGFSLARIRINFRNTDDDGNILPDSWERRAALKAQERGARVWASPWSAHSSLKEGPVAGEHGHRGGRLRDDAYGTYAQNLVDFVRWAEGEGIDLLAISPQNEPDYRFRNNESMDWEAGELLSFISDYFRPALNTAGYADLPIVAPELMDWHRRSGWEAFRQHPDTGILAFHNYDWAFDFFSRGSDTRYPRAVDTDKPIWMTEISDVFSGEDFTDTIEDALVWARHIHRVIAEAGGSAWHWWWFAPAEHGINNNETLLATRAGVYSGGQPIEGPLEVLKRGYGIAQFARFVRRGDRMIAMDYPRAAHPRLLLSAYHGRDRVTLVAINEEDAPAPIRIEGIPPHLAQITAWMTTADESLSSQGHMPRPKGFPLDFTLPAKSIVTFVFQ
jgi:glucuronoarabinoxylan endo-1,4-beta-xylanase